MYYESYPKASETFSSKSIQNNFSRHQVFSLLEFRIMTKLKLDKCISRIYFDF